MTEVPNGRMRSLDSLRGIASLVVLFHHCAQNIPSLEAAPLAVHILNGSGAVLIFFVLSGLVLAMTCLKRDRDDYFPFIVKRFFRIWPPFAVAILVAACLRLLIGHHEVPGATKTFAQYAASPITLSSVALHLGLVGTAGDLDPPMWSLIHEMRISMIFPALVVLTVMRWRVALAVAVTVSLAAGRINFTEPLLASMDMTLRFAVLFVMGIVIAYKRVELLSYVARSSRGVRVLLWLVCLVGVAASPDFSDGRWTFVTGLRLLVDGFASAGIVVLCAAGGRLGQWLARPLPVYLGRISYSLYLWHIVVLTCVLQAFRGMASVPVLVGVTVLLSLGIADLSERFIERPTTEFGRRLARMVVTRRRFGMVRQLPNA